MGLKAPPMPKEEIVRLGEAIFAERIAPLLTEEQRGLFLAVDVRTGEYEIDADEMAVVDRLWARMENPVPHLIRIGFRAAHTIGSRLQ